jgi:hypothetical protein
LRLRGLAVKYGRGRHAAVRSTQIQNFHSPAMKS